MKKLVMAAALVATVFSANAQDSSSEPIKSKRGYAILPEAGNWGLSVDANPLIRYTGNLMSQAGNNNGSNPFNGTTITGKYFIDANTAYRVSVGINMGTTSKTNLVSDNTSTDATKTVEDKRTISQAGIVLGAGMEKRRGVGRLQGVYGAMATISIGGGNGNQSFEYGNSFTTTNTNPTSTTNFDNNASGPVNSRTTSTKSGFGFGVGLQGFIGVEYFFAPKISLGAEYMWGPTFRMTGKGSTETESFDGTAVKTTTSETGGSSSFNLGTGTANINLNFYF
jgi:hypothetical protein